MSPVASTSPGTPPSHIPIAIKRASGASLGSGTPGSQSGTPPPRSVSRASHTSPRSDDADARHANIRSMHTALVASHARSQELTAALLGDSPGTAIQTPASGRSDRRFSPGLLDDDDAGSLVSDEDPVRAPTQSSLNKMRQKAIPHSSPLYDLKRRAATPSENGTPQRDDRLGLSRIPRATVTHAVSLHSTSPAASPTSFRAGTSPSSTTGMLRSPLLGHSPDVSPVPPSSAFPSPSYPFPSSSPYDAHGPSPSVRRVPSGAGPSASTRVIDDLQTQLQDSSMHVLKLRQEAKNSRRAIEALTRQVEDMKDKRDRMQVELNTATNVVARKERQNQELVQRARTAEAELATFKADKKALERDTKRAVADAQADAADAAAARQRAEAEYAALSDAIRSLRDVWGRDVKRYRDELEARDAAARTERDELREKQAALHELVSAQASNRAEAERLVRQAEQQSAALAARFTDDVAGLRAQLGASDAANREARDTAAQMARELQHLRRLMRTQPRAELVDIAHAGDVGRAEPAGEAQAHEAPTEAT
ncbi:hypothetical protein Q5752_006078 [Cryptotrichosporon argae]